MHPITGDYPTIEHTLMANFLLLYFKVTLNIHCVCMAISRCSFSSSKSTKKTRGKIRVLHPACTQRGRNDWTQNNISTIHLWMDFLLPQALTWYFAKSRISRNLFLKTISRRCVQLPEDVKTPKRLVIFIATHSGSIFKCAGLHLVKVRIYTAAHGIF